MDVRVKFLGAAGEVTGSKYLLTIGDFNLLVDCGLFQGRKQLRLLNWDDFPVPPQSVDAVIITHAHLDHTGYLPRLFKMGYQGPVYCTTATAEVMHLILMDSATLQEEEARWAKKKGYSKHEDPQPLYTADDVVPIADHLKTTHFEHTLQIAPHIALRFCNAGHILGAAIVELTISGSKQTKKIVFSGDLGRYNDPILYPPHAMEEADVLFVESTYGNRETVATPRDEIIEMLNDCFDADGNVIMPAFSIGRTQNLLMYLKNVLQSREIPAVRIFLDSPMAISATEIYRKYGSYHRIPANEIDEEGGFLNLDKYLHICRTAEDSKKINEYLHDNIIIAGSGMMTGGRILHHLYHRLSTPENVILITGFQSEDSRGRRLQEGAKTLKLFGQEVPVNAKIYTINGLSAHADRKELLQWLSGFKEPPKITFAVHGEQESAGALATTLKERGWNATVPHYLENVELFKGI
jgi:metallo-beta-lactamase family protein